MKKESKLFKGDEGSKEQDRGSEKTEVDVKRKIVDEKKPKIQNQMEIMRRSLIMNSTIGKSLDSLIQPLINQQFILFIDVVFNDLKQNLKNESKSSPLIELAEQITKESSGTALREKQEKFECAIGNNFRTALTVNDETEKNNLIFLHKKVEEEENALKEFLKLNQASSHYINLVISCISSSFYLYIIEIERNSKI